MPPSLICGDLNGTPESVVLSYLKGYSWKCALSQGLLEGGGGVGGGGVVTPHVASDEVSNEASNEASNDPDEASSNEAPSNEGSSEGSSEGSNEAPPHRWVSHRSHEGRSIGVDYILLQNPSTKRGEPTAPLPLGPCPSAPAPLPLPPCPPPLPPPLPPPATHTLPTPYPHPTHPPPPTPPPQSRSPTGPIASFRRLRRRSSRAGSPLPRRRGTRSSA